jgi:coenzyme Q-binding protein COQ10
MPSYTQQEVLPYGVQQVYDLVADVAKYPEFLPWCSVARILGKTDQGFLAELVIRYQAFSQSYISDVKLTPPDNISAAQVEATMVSGPFHHLLNRWIFTSEGNHTRVEFFIDFEFNSSLLAKLLGGFFDRAVLKMMEAFKQRAQSLYGMAPSK